jgi:fatty acid desaturase
MTTRKPFEWPTALLAIAIYGGWAAVTWHHAALPWWVLVPVGGWLVAWHGSLQHEVIHGHFTPWNALDRLIALPPLALYLPYDLYRDSHCRHHRDDRLTDPHDDPESRYRTPEDWRRLDPVRRALIAAQATVIGRLVIGPAWEIARALVLDARAAVTGDRDVLVAWVWHLPFLGLVLWWVVVVVDMDPATYVACFVLPGVGLTLMRSFAEHRAVAAIDGRTAVVENFLPFGLLYLFNNLHIAHHADPKLAWYRLPAAWRARRSAVLAAGRAPIYAGYLDLWRRFALRPHDQPVHPLGRAP